LASRSRTAPATENVPLCPDVQLCVFVTPCVTRRRPAVLAEERVPRDAAVRVAAHARRRGAEPARRPRVSRLRPHLPPQGQAALAEPAPGRQAVQALSLCVFVCLVSLLYGWVRQLMGIDGNDRTLTVLQRVEEGEAEPYH
jgi:hypothetical protein